MVEHQFIKCINDKPHVEWLHLWYRSGWHGHIWANDVLITRHLGVPSGASNTVSEPMVRLEQTVHLSYINTNTISKRTKQDSTWPTSSRSSIDAPKWFHTLWYFWRKPFTDLVSRLALSPNEPKRASSWASSPKSTIGCVLKDIWGYGTFGANRAPILH